MAVAIPATGYHISSVGGVLGFSPWNAASVAGGSTPTAPASLMSGNYVTFLDCLWWELDYTSFIDDTTQTDCWGPGYDVAMVGGIYTAMIKWDAYAVPDIVARLGVPPAVPAVSMTVSGYLSCNFSVSSFLFCGNGVNYPESNTTADYFFIPSTKMKMQKPRVDPNNKKMVTMLIQGMSSGSPPYHMPEEAARLSAYGSFLTSRNRVW